MTRRVQATRVTPLRITDRELSSGTPGPTRTDRLIGVTIAVALGLLGLVVMSGIVLMFVAYFRS